MNTFDDGLFEYEAVAFDECSLTYYPEIVPSLLQYEPNEFEVSVEQYTPDIDCFGYDPISFDSATDLDSPIYGDGLDTEEFLEKYGTAHIYN